ncbi:MAG: hypothetical protein ACI9WU_004044 [Myxococcota bacterium]
MEKTLKGSILSVVLALAVAGVAATGCSDEFRCSKDYDCPATRVCNLASGVCEPFVCEVDADCIASDQLCAGNACVARTGAGGDAR